MIVKMFSCDNVEKAFSCSKFSIVFIAVRDFKDLFCREDSTVVFEKGPCCAGQSRYSWIIAIVWKLLGLISILALEGIHFPSQICKAVCSQPKERLANMLQQTVQENCFFRWNSWFSSGGCWTGVSRFSGKLIEVSSIYCTVLSCSKRFHPICRNVSKSWSNFPETRWSTEISSCFFRRIQPRAQFYYGHVISQTHDFGTLGGKRIEMHSPQQGKGHIFGLSAAVSRDGLVESCTCRGGFPCSGPDPLPRLDHPPGAEPWPGPDTPLLGRTSLPAGPPPRSTLPDQVTSLTWCTDHVTFMKREASTLTSLFGLLFHFAEPNTQAYWQGSQPGTKRAACLSKNRKENTLQVGNETNASNAKITIALPTIEEESEQMQRFQGRLQQEIAIKWFCNCLSTGAYVKSGKIFRNYMVDVRVRWMFHRVSSVIFFSFKREWTDSHEILSQMLRPLGIRCLCVFTWGTSVCAVGKWTFLTPPGRKQEKTCFCYLSLLDKNRRTKDLQHISCIKCLFVFAGTGNCMTEQWELLRWDSGKRTWHFRQKPMSEANQNLLTCCMSGAVPIFGVLLMSNELVLLQTFCNCTEEEAAGLLLRSIYQVDKIPDRVSSLPISSHIEQATPMNKVGFWNLLLQTINSPLHGLLCKLACARTAWKRPNADPLTIS